MTVYVSAEAFGKRAARVVHLIPNCPLTKQFKLVPVDIAELRVVKPCRFCHGEHLRREQERVYRDQEKVFRGHDRRKL